MSDNNGAAAEEGKSNASPIELSDDENPSATPPSEKQTGESNDSPIDMTGEDPKKIGVAKVIFQNVCNRIADRLTRNKETTTTATPSDNASRSEPPDVEKLRHLIWTAEYEAFQDPYRGIQFLQQAQRNALAASSDDQEQKEKEEQVTELPNPSNRPITPWDACQCGILSDVVVAERLAQALQDPDMTSQQEDGDGSLILDPKNPQTLVRTITEAQCPSLTAWTRQMMEEDAKKRAALNKKKRGKKRARDERESTPPLIPCLGKRPSDSKYQCPCDYNPFCLVSLGGVVNDILQERCEKDISISVADDDDVEKQSKNGEKKKQVKGSLSSYWDKKNAEKSNGRVSEEVTVINNPNNGKATSIMTMDSMSGETDRFKYGEKGDNKETASKTGKTDGVLTCTRLGSKRAEPATGKPGDVYAQELDQQCLQEIKYSQATKEELEKLRKLRLTGCSKIMTTVRGMMKQCPSEKRSLKTAEEYMNAIIEWHQSLLFVPPTAEERAVPNGQFTVALPPGIQNLGATCYLNTQLQCLAQNPVFLEGIFSWRAVNSEHNMNGVMTKLQKLLAQMVFGGDRKLSTLDFSNALGLEHYEQQDPNEFARLLFDRMEESFQQCSEGMSDSDVPEADLSDLLRRIFHGTTTYETTCMECGNVSARTEGFMDLNLPIATPVIEVDGDSENGSGDKKKQAKEGTIEAAFAKQRRRQPNDTTVQVCLDEYLKPEILDGDNQYFCEKCNRKQSATRIPKLTCLPPVLNVQLSRYVFDREKFVKKKLTDKVLLPTVLAVDCNNDSESKHYILCAVMKHQGNSAYSGHYIAEAMDWTTGMWYEFNDETVKVLSSGPSSSFVPVLDDAYSSSDDSGLFPLVDGSQDAYNMYYVDKEYLARKGLQTIERRLAFTKNDHNGEALKSSVLADVLKERESKYSILGEMCMFDWAVSDRLKRRKLGIRKYMFVDSSSLIAGTSQTDNHALFWVEGESLRRFLSCEPCIDEDLKSTKSIICPASTLCVHGRLAPRDAIRGKLLRKDHFDAYVSLLTGERKHLSDTGPSVSMSSVVGTVLKAPDNLVCEQCSEESKASLTEKIELIRNFTNLYVTLNEENKESKCVRESECIYIVSKSWVSSFKKVFGSLLKTVANFEEGDSLVSSKEGSSLVLAGLADIDLASFSRSIGKNVPKPKKGEKDTTTVLDERVNGKITCAHGKCIPINKKLVRFVSSETWSVIQKCFPNAIEHKLLKEIGTMDVPRDGCSACQREKESVKVFREEIERWASTTRRNLDLKELLDDKSTASRDITRHNFHAAKSCSRLVYGGDIDNFRRAVKMAARVIRREGVDSGAMKDRLEKIAFPQFHSVIYEFERESVGKLLSSLRSLICRAHKKVISSALYGEDNSDGQSLSKSIAVLSEEEYHAYVSSLTKLLGILNGDTTNQYLDLESEGASKVVNDVLNDLATYHPILHKQGDINGSSSILELSSAEGDFKTFILSPDGFCDCETCFKEFAPLLEQQKPGVEADVDNVSIESDSDVGKSKIAKESTIGAEASNPIVVESDDDKIPNGLEVRVFELKPGSTLDEARANLRVAAGQNLGHEESRGGTVPRRSSRRRKTVFPVGCITKETKVTIGLHYNLAAVRLFLFERCEVPLSSKLLAGFIPGDPSVMPSVIDLDPSSNEDSLEDVMKRQKKTKIFANCLESDLGEKFFILHKKDGDDAGVVHSSMFDSLLTISNADTSNESNGGKKGKRKRASERGFRGTLLQSSSSVGIEDDENQSKKKRSIESGESSKKLPVSDEESSTKPVVCEEVENMPADDTPDETSDEEPILRPNQESSQLKAGPAPGARNANPEILQVESDDERPTTIEYKDRFTPIFDAARRADRGDERVDEITLAEAVRWVLTEFPTESDSEIQNMAYGRYLEILDGPSRSRKNLDDARNKSTEIGCNGKMSQRIDRLIDNVQPMLGKSRNLCEIRRTVENFVKAHPNYTAEKQLEAVLDILMEE